MRRHCGCAGWIETSHSVDADPSGHAKTFDVVIDVDDPLRPDTLRVLSLLTAGSAANAASTEQITKLDDQVRRALVPLTRPVRESPGAQIADTASRIRALKTKRDTLAALAADPVTFLRHWLASQAGDLDRLLAGADRGAQALGGVTADHLRSAEFYRAPWLVDAINLHQGRLFGAKVQTAVAGGGVPSAGAQQLRR